MNQKYIVAMAGICQCCIKADTENIASFIAKYGQYTDITMATLQLYPFLTTCGGFIDRCYDQDFLKEELLSALVPMQIGEKEPQEIVFPQSFEDFNEDTAPVPNWSCSEGHGIFNLDIPKPSHGWKPEYLKEILETNDSFQNRFNQYYMKALEQEGENENLER